LKDSVAILVIRDPVNATYRLYPTSDTSAGAVQQDQSGNFRTGPLQNDTTVYITTTIGSCTNGPTAVPIKVVETLQLLMPGAFTPNGDGNNDLFHVKYPALLKSFHMVVFNRWGMRVCDTSDPVKGWDGRFQGVMQPTGAYVWYISYVDILGRSKTISGDVLLVR